MIPEKSEIGKTDSATTRQMLRCVLRIDLPKKIPTRIEHAKVEVK